jgi:hypothetical protein
MCVLAAHSKAAAVKFSTPTFSFCYHAAWRSHFVVASVARLQQQHP